jgi:maleylacetoacetate isomerase
MVALSGSLKLYSYWRSSAAYRVRIALNLKALPHDIVPVHLTASGGEQHGPEFRGLNPQELVPVLQHGSRVIRQSLAIIEYLEETWPRNPVMPATARDRARVRGLAQLIACDIHPLNNLRVLKFFDEEWSVPQPERDLWVRHWIETGLAAFERLLIDHPATGEFCDGETPTLADCALIPQVYNARRFGVDVSAWPTIDRIQQHCATVDPFVRAHPDNQPDAPAAY